MQKMVAPGNHSCYTFPGRKSRQDPGSILAGLHNQERLTSWSKIDRFLHQGGKVGRILHRILSERKVGRILHYNFTEMNFLRVKIKSL